MNPSLITEEQLRELRHRLRLHVHFFKSYPAEGIFPLLHQLDLVPDDIVLTAFHEDDQQARQQLGDREISDFTRDILANLQAEIYNPTIPFPYNTSSFLGEVQRHLELSYWYRPDYDLYMPEIERLLTQARRERRKYAQCSLSAAIYRITGNELSSRLSHYLARCSVKEPKHVLTTKVEDLCAMHGFGPACRREFLALQATLQIYLSRS